MPLKRTEPRSIRWQLVLLFTAAATVLLSAGLGVLYWIIVRHAFEEDNVFFADKIAAVRADLHKPSGAVTLRDELQSDGAETRLAYWVRIIDSSGQPIAETAGMDRVLPVDLFPAAQWSAASNSPKDYRSGSRLFSLVTMAEDAGDQVYTIQIAQDRSGDEAFTRHFGALVAGLLVAGVGASMAIAITVTKRGLRPLGEITEAVERISPTHLDERVSPGGWPRELQPLATAFDRMLDRLEESFTRLSQFSADLAHELRTPIGNIRGEAEVALTRTRTSEEYREVIESTVAECERLSAIIDNLLFLARAEAHEPQVHRTNFSGREALEKMAAYYQAMAEEHRVTIICRGEGEVYADPTLFGRAVSNLLENALRFTPDGGEITVSLATDTAHSEVVVKDTGSGISREHLPKIFDRFYRVDQSRSSGGAGLGLALVKSIADMHGAKVSLRSEVGEGTTVSVRFPKSVDVAKPTASQAEITNL